MLTTEHITSGAPFRSRKRPAPRRVGKRAIDTRNSLPLIACAAEWMLWNLLSFEMKSTAPPKNFERAFDVSDS